MLSLSTTVKEKVPATRAFFVRTANGIMGKNYDLSLVFIGDKRSRSLNSAYRNIDKPTDILSFELDKKSGEIFIDLEQARKKSKLFDQTYPNYLKYLFIHGLCHLKGMAHGSRMEKLESKYVTLYLSRN